MSKGNKFAKDPPQAIAEHMLSFSSEEDVFNFINTFPDPLVIEETLGSSQIEILVDHNLIAILLSDEVESRIKINVLLKTHFVGTLVFDKELIDYDIIRFLTLEERQDLSWLKRSKLDFSRLGLTLEKICQIQKYIPKNQDSKFLICEYNGLGELVKRKEYDGNIQFNDGSIKSCDRFTIDQYSADGNLDKRQECIENGKFNPDGSVSSYDRLVFCKYNGNGKLTLREEKVKMIHVGEGESYDRFVVCQYNEDEQLAKIYEHSGDIQFNNNRVTSCDRFAVLQYNENGKLAKQWEHDGNAQLNEIGKITSCDKFVISHYNENGKLDGQLNHDGKVQFNEDGMVKSCDKFVISHYNENGKLAGQLNYDGKVQFNEDGKVKSCDKYVASIYNEYEQLTKQYEHNGNVQFTDDGEAVKSCDEFIDQMSHKIYYGNCSFDISDTGYLLPPSKYDGYCQYDRNDSIISLIINLDDGNKIFFNNKGGEFQMNEESKKLLEEIKFNADSLIKIDPKHVDLETVTILKEVLNGLFSKTPPKSPITMARGSKLSGSLRPTATQTLLHAKKTGCIDNVHQSVSI